MNVIRLVRLVYGFLYKGYSYNEAIKSKVE